MFGSQRYPEGHFKPERGGGSNWHVWCHTGALQVLQHSEYVEWLNCHPDGSSYIINFANGSAARISPGDPLWQALVRVSKTHEVAVYPLTWKGQYEVWTGDEKDHRYFDAIRIKKRIV